MVEKKLLLLAILLPIIMTVHQYCEVDPEPFLVYLMNNTGGNIQLGPNIRGYNLNLTGPQLNGSSIIPPVLDLTTPMGFGEGYTVFDSVVLTSSYYLPQSMGVVLSQNSGTIGIKYGSFVGNDFTKGKIVYHTLGQNVTCYSGQIVSDDLDVVVDCASHADNLVCVITSSTAAVSCKSMSSFVASGDRVSAVLELDTQTYFITATLTQYVEQPFQNNTFLTIYNIADGKVQFNDMINRNMLGLDTLSITGMKVKNMKGSTYIILSDINNQLIKFTYSVTNQVSNIIVTSIPGSPSQIAISHDNTVLVALPTSILEMCHCAEHTIRAYQLQVSQPSISDMQASWETLTVLTTNNQLLIYNRTLTSYHYLISAKQYSATTFIALSPFYNSVLVFSAMQQLLSISEGYLFLPPVNKDMQMEVVGTSGGLTCKLNVKLTVVNEKRLQQVIQKKSFKSSMYKFDAQNTMPINLNAYFGGNQLSYSTEVPNPHIHTPIKHISSYNFPTINDEYIFTQILDIDDQSYYMVGINTTHIISSLCTTQSSDISCVVQNEAWLKGEVVAIDGRRRQNGDYLVSWAYKTNQVEMFKMGEYLKFAIYHGTGYHYSSVTVGENHVYYVQKYENTLQVLSDIKLYSFNQASFTEEELKLMGGFYPRDVMINPSNPNMIYVKFPTSIVTMHFSEGKLTPIANRPVMSEIISSDAWTFVVGRHTGILFLPDQITQFCLVNGLFMVQPTQTINIDGNFSIPVRYSEKSNTVLVRTEENSLVFIRLNEQVVNTKYYKVELGNSDAWVSDGNWVLVDERAFWVNKQPVMEVQVDGQGQRRESTHLFVTVEAAMQKSSSAIDIVFVNYPQTIRPISVDTDPIQLPETANHTVVQFPVQEYFAGNVGNYQIMCVFSLENKLKLLPPFRHLSTNQLVDTPLQIQPLSDSNILVLSANNVLFMVDKDNNFITSYQIKAQALCSRMGVEGTNVVVFCSASDGQTIITFEVSNGKIDEGKRYSLADTWVEHPQQIAVMWSDTVMSVLVLDGDGMDYSLNKVADIKLVTIDNGNSSTIIIDASTFGLQPMPINSFTTNGNNLLASVGNRGVGYVDLGSMKASFLDLSTEDATSDYVMDDSLFLTISHMGQDDYLLVTSTGLTMVVQLQLTDSSVSLTGVKELYSRYAQETTLNWAEWSGQSILLSYYNKTTMLQTIALYGRNKKAINNFYASMNRTVRWEELSLPVLRLVSIENNRSLFGSKISNINSQHLVLYNLTKSFGLWASYDKPSNFQFIKVVASNAYGNSSKRVSVFFDQPDVGGLKWYAVVIIVVLVLILVGAAFVMYLRMRAKKSNKKVSLFTESEQLDEQI